MQKEITSHPNGHKLFHCSDYHATGNKAVDFVAQTVDSFRGKLIPVRAIYLKKHIYDMFFVWVLEQACKRHGAQLGADMVYDTIASGKALEFDSVDIRELNSQAEAKMKYTIGKQHSPDGAYMEKLGTSGWIEIYPQKILN